MTLLKKRGGQDGQKEVIHVMCPFQICVLYNLSF